MPLLRHRFIVSFLLVAAGCLVGRPVFGQPADSQAQDRAAIRRATADYLAAIRQGDAAKVAEFWTSQGVFIDAGGQETNGRDLARQVRPRTQDDEPQPPPPTIDTTIRFVTADVAIEDGTAPELNAEAPSETIGHYSAIWVKQDGKWLLDRVREYQVTKTSPRDYLRVLAWMVGSWQSDGGEVRVEMTCDWTDDRNFLAREIVVSPPDARPIKITQRIGWDASKRQIKAWTFDSTGGHGEAVWSPQGNQWMVEGTAVTSEGTEATSKSTYLPKGDGEFIWESTQATVAGIDVSDQQLRMVRKPREK